MKNFSIQIFKKLINLDKEVRSSEKVFKKKSLLLLKQQTRRFEAGEDAEVRGERGGERNVRADTEKLLGTVRGHRR